ncbi:MAG: hypothetical protein NTW19_10875 [Planctomycetota bacterium]|nr:hypothetical protein [Planctomycetota bacterium]
MRRFNCIYLFMIVALLCSQASSDEAPPSKRWHVAAAPESRLVNGWMRLERDGDSLRIREYVGGGTDQDVLRDPLDLSLTWLREDGVVRLLVTRNWKDRTAGMKWTPAIPKDAELRVQMPREFTAMGDEHQVLWQADVVQKDKVISTLVFVARLAPAKDGVTVFDGNEATKALDAIKKAMITK